MLYASVSSGISCQRTRIKTILNGSKQARNPREVKEIFVDLICDYLNMVDKEEMASSSSDEQQDEEMFMDSDEEVQNT